MVEHQLVYNIVPDPTVSITPLTAQTVGQSLTLECRGTTVRGITSDVVFEWRHSGSTVNTTSVSTAAMDSLLVYRVSYTIPQLSTSDDNGIYNCRLTVRSSPRRRTIEPVTLDLTGECFTKFIIGCVYHSKWCDLHN